MPRIKIVVIWLLSILAALTILTHVAQFAGLTFRTYALVSLALAFVVALIAFLLLRPAYLTASCLDRKSILLLAAACLIGMALALLINDPAADDYLYASNVVYYAQHPSAPMGYEIHFLYSDTAPFSSAFWSTSGAYEYIQGAVAYILGIDFLTLYYVVSAAWVGLMIPLAIFLLLGHFSEDARSAAFGALLTVAGLSLLGDTPRTFGSYSFAHPSEGKVLLLAALLPLYAGFCLDFFKAPSPLSWTSLFVASTVAVGLSASAAYLVPALALALAIARIFTTWQGFGAALRTYSGYFTSLAYLALYALFIFTHGAAQLGVESAANVGWPRDFAGHLAFLVNPQLPVTAVVLAASTLAAVWLLPRERRTPLALWILAVLVLFLNPVVAPFLIAHVTTPNAYWRLFYVYPFPLTIGIGAAAIFSRTRQVAASTQLLAAVLGCGLLVSAHLLLPEASILRGQGVELGPARYKVPPADLNIARQVIAVAPPGPMLAPGDVAGPVVMLDSRFPQLRLAKESVRVWLSAQGRPDEAERRIAASDYLDGRPSGDLGSLQELLQGNDAVRSIVARSGVYKRAEVKALLTHYGFTQRETIDGFVILWK